MIRGVNLGNWLVLEKWMSPELFDGTTAEDETYLCIQLADDVKQDRFKVHRDSYVTDRDFAYLASRGIELVRLPVPYFVFGDREPFVGCIEYVDAAFRWGERYGIKILVDLHTVPESQNGFDNGGLRGVCKFHKNPENVDFALSVLERLAARYGSHSSLWGIEVLNEPVSPEMWELLDIPERFKAVDSESAEGSEAVPTEFLKTFYRAAYDRIRAHTDEAIIVFHDGFRMKEWVGFFEEPEFRNIAVDTHMYLVERFMSSGDADLEAILDYVDVEFAGTLQEMSKHFPIFVGEWALDPYSPKAYALTGEERLAYYRQFGAQQLKAFENAIGWTYWSYRLHTEDPRFDAWDLLKAIESGLLPQDLTAP